MNSPMRHAFHRTAFATVMLLATTTQASARRDLLELVDGGYQAPEQHSEEDLMPLSMQSDSPSDDDMSGDLDRLFDTPTTTEPSEQDASQAWQLASADDDSRIIPDILASREVLIADVRDVGGLVSGIVVNRSSRTLRDVTVLIRQTWLWKDERNPGTDNPGRAIPYVLSDPIAPNGSRAFALQFAPLPERSDGRFVTTAEVTSFTEVGN